ncbi:hypothetical protein ACX80E_12445 [Arthrobacter sp. TMN-49]
MEEKTAPLDGIHTGQRDAERTPRVSRTGSHTASRCGAAVSQAPDDCGKVRELIRVGLGEEFNVQPWRLGRNTVGRVAACRGRHAPPRLDHGLGPEHFAGDVIAIEGTEACFRHGAVAVAAAAAAR